MGLTGDLSKLKMGDLFQTLEGSRQVGVLKVWRQGESREVYFGPQGVSLLHLANLTTQRLADRFRNTGEITDEDIASAKRHAETHGSTFGQVLVQRNLVAGEEIERAVQEQAEELLYDMFGWSDGNFEFLDDRKPDGAELGPYPLDPFPIGPVLLEGARRIDEWAEIERQVPDRGEVFVAAPLSAAQRNELDADERAVFEAIDGRTDLRALADRTLGTLFDTAKVVAALADRELVRLATLDELIASAENEFAQNRRERARALLDLVVDRRAPRLRRNLDQIARLYAGMGEKERACDLRSFVAGQLIATENYAEAQVLLQEILALCPDHLNSNRRLLQVLDEVERDSAAAFEQRVRLVEILSSKRETESDARQYCGMLTAAPPRDALLVRRGAAAAMKAGDKESALSLLHFAAAIDREGGQRQRLIETYREILKLDRSDKEIAQALRQVLISQKARQRRRAMIAAGVLVGLGAATWWLTAAWNASSASALLQQAEELGRRDAQAALLALNQLDESYASSFGVGEVMEAASRTRQSLQRRVAEDQRRKEDDAQRQLSARLAEAGAHIDAHRFGEALPIYRELLGRSLTKNELETIRFRILSAVEALAQWDLRMRSLLDRSTPEQLARQGAAEIAALREELEGELARVNESSLAGLREGLKEPAIEKLLPKRNRAADEELLTRIGVLHVKGELLSEELTQRLAAYSRTDELEKLLGDAAKAERENRWAAAAELYRLLAQSSIEEGLRGQFVQQAERLEGIVAKLRTISTATEQRDFAAAVTAYQELAEEAPDLDLRGKIRLPFLLRSIPTGAEVHEGSQLLGHTPLPVEFDPFRAATLIVKSPGFEPEVIQIKGFDRGDATLVLRTPPLWRLKGRGPIDSAPFVRDGVTYVADRAGSLRGLDLERRELLFETVLSEEMGGLRGSAFPRPGGIATVSWDGVLQEVDGRTGAGGASRRLAGEGAWNGPICAGERLWFVRGSGLLVEEPRATAEASEMRELARPAVQLRAWRDGVLVALQGGRLEHHRASTPQPLWAVETKISILHVITAGAAAWVFGADGSVLHIDLERGAELSRWKLPAAPAREPSASSGRLFVPMTREILGLDPRTGEELLRWPLEGLQVTATPVSDEEHGRLLVATDKGLEVFELEKSRISWRHRTSVPIAVAPLVTAHGVLIALGDGTLELLPRR